jgi:hypothetical protein
MSNVLLVGKEKLKKGGSDFYVASALEVVTDKQNNDPFGDLDSGDTFIAADFSPSSKILSEFLKSYSGEPGSKDDPIEAFQKVMGSLLEQTYEAGKRSINNK